MKNFKELQNHIESKIQSSHEEGVTGEVAERFGAELLQALMTVSSELTKADLDSRMRKSGVKAIRAAIYLDSASKGDKKPTEAALAAMVDSNEIVSGEQTAFDTAEVYKNELERLYSIFTNAHIFYRGIAKGSFQ